MSKRNKKSKVNLNRRKRNERTEETYFKHVIELAKERYEDFLLRGDDFGKNIEGLKRYLPSEYKEFVDTLWLFGFCAGHIESIIGDELDESS